jgi:tetratricopeptide (TPR) repeat protein
VTPDWFRNETWNDAIEREFRLKLRRARRKGQYLRIQASVLADSHPEVALSLLDEYFRLPEDFDWAQGHVDRATALVALGRLDDAVGSFEAALAREAAFPNLQTEAVLKLPYLIAMKQLRPRYQRALQLLRISEERLMFPADRFRWHAAQALIAADSGNSTIARHHAEHALQAASAEHSGFRYHPSAGLIGDGHENVIRRLTALTAQRPPC